MTARIELDQFWSAKLYAQNVKPLCAQTIEMNALILGMSHQI